MTANLCVVCDRPTPDGYACTGCGITRPAGQLAEIAELCGPARDVAHGQTSRGSAGGSGKPGPHMELDLGATQVLTTVHDRLARQCLRIAVKRGSEYRVSCLPSCIKPSPSNAHCGSCHVTFGSVSGFDRHRRGGQCIEPEALPMHQDDRGRWRINAEDGATARYSTPQTDETASVVPRPTPDDSNAAETLTGGTG